MPNEASWRSWLARRPVTAEVAGSSPVEVAEASRPGRHGRADSIRGSVAQLVERSTENRKVTGSTPVGATAKGPDPTRIRAFAMPTGRRATVFQVAQSVRPSKGYRTRSVSVLGVSWGVSRFVRPSLCGSRGLLRVSGWCPIGRGGWSCWWVLGDGSGLGWCHGGRGPGGAGRVWWARGWRWL